MQRKPSATIVIEADIHSDQVPGPRSLVMRLVQKHDMVHMRLVQDESDESTDILLSTTAARRLATMLLGMTKPDTREFERERNEMFRQFTKVVRSVMPDAPESSLAVVTPIRPDDDDSSRGDR